MPKRKGEIWQEEKNITFDMKLDIIELFDNGQRKTNIGMALGLSESTVQLILSRCNKVNLHQHLQGSSALETEVLY